MNSSVLRVEDLRVYYHTPRGPVRAVDGVNFQLHPGERLGLVGESGSGKSTTAFALMRLIKPPGRIESGSIFLHNTDLVQLPEDEMRKVRLAQIALVPQGAMNSLNPVLKIKDQLIDAMQDHLPGTPKREMEEKVGHLLERVGLQPRVARMYPHELSGGMKQRVCIAIAISLEPKVIIADEPTSALDVVVQRQVMETLGQVQQDLGASVILVGHDMGLMAQFVDTIGVMYAGRLVELGPVKDVFRKPLHPYTRLLITTLPNLDSKRQFRGIPGLPPSLLNPPAGCVFHPRCPQVFERCSREVPTLKEVEAGRWVACHLY